MSTSPDAKGTKMRHSRETERKKEREKKREKKERQRKRERKKDTYNIKIKRKL